MPIVRVVLAVALLAVLAVALAGRQAAPQPVPPATCGTHGTCGQYP